MNIKIYTTPTCGYCHKAKKFFSDRGVNFTEYDVSRDRTAAQAMMRETGQMGVPVIVVDGEVIIGFNRPRLEQLLAGRSNGQHIHFGLSIADANKVIHKHGISSVSGVFVGKVAASSLGERAGLKAGDIITEINLCPIHNADDMEKALLSLTKGSKVVISYLRGHSNLKSEIVV